MNNDARISALRDQAQLLDQTGRTIEALPIQKEAVELAATNFDDQTEVIQRERLIFYLYRCGLNDEALDEIERASALTMSSPMPFSVTLRLADTSANVLDELGQLDLALTIVQAATNGAHDARLDGHTTLDRPLAALLDKQASFHHRLRQYDRAIDIHNEALAIWKSLADNDVEDHISLAKSLHGLSLSLLLTNQLKEANESLYEAIQIVRKSAQDDIQFQYEVPPLLITLGTFYDLYDKPEQAINAMAEGVEIFKALYRDEPVRYTERLALSLERLSALEARRDNEEAMSLQSECVDLLRDLVNRDISRRMKLAQSLVTLAKRQMACDSFVPAKNNIDEAIELYEFLSEYPDVESHLAKALEARAALALQNDES